LHRDCDKLNIKCDCLWQIHRDVNPCHTKIYTVICYLFFNILVSGDIELHAKLNDVKIELQGFLQFSHDPPSVSIVVLIVIELLFGFFV
jgi:hypothetical protein